MKKDKTKKKGKGTQLKDIRNNKGQFAEGNNLHLIATEQGRPKKYTPLQLATKANEYFNHIDSNPIHENVIHQRTGDIIQIPKQRPYTIQALCNYLNITVSMLHYYNNLKEDDETASDFKNIITRIKQICYAQKLEGASVGIFNANIIARELGLTDKQEVQTTGNKRLKIEIVNTAATAAPADTIEIQGDTAPATDIKTLNSHKEPPQEQTTQGTTEPQQEPPNSAAS